MAQNPLTKLKSTLNSRWDDARKASRIIELADKLPFTDEVVQTLDDALPAADPLVRVAIMEAYFEISGDPYHEGDLEDLMRRAVRMGDKGEELYMAARIALGNINGMSMDRMDGWGDGQLEIVATSRRRRRQARRGRRSKTVNEITIIIHGTWASDGTWWRPGGDFFDYAATTLQRDAYGKSDQFKWSGKNRDKKRKQASTELRKWIKDHPARDVHIFAHSHGANVAMLATHHGVKVNRLVMLSPPVRKDYFADWRNVQHAYNIQADFDPVVAIARGGQWFRNHHVKEKKMPVNGHSKSHESEVWKRLRLDRFIDLPW